MNGRAFAAGVSALLALGMCSCASALDRLRVSESAAPSSPAIPTTSTSTMSSAAPTSAPVPPLTGSLSDQLRELVRRLPDRDLITSATLGDAVPDGAGATGTGKWISLESDAAGTQDQFRVAWESQVIVAALWKNNGETNAVVNGGGIVFSRGNEIGVNEDEHNAFPADAKKYLFTDSDDDPAILAVPRDQVAATIRAEAQKMHVQVQSIDFFSALGTNALVVATAPSLDAIDSSVALFGDYTNMEGAYFLLLDDEGNELAQWCHSTGFQSGAGGLDQDGGDIFR